MGTFERLLGKWISRVGEVGGEGASAGLSPRFRNALENVWKIEERGLKRGEYSNRVRGGHRNRYVLKVTGKKLRKALKCTGIDKRWRSSGAAMPMYTST